MTPALLPVPELTLEALGTHVRASGQGAFAALNEVRRLEGLLTRFRPSPLTRLNAHGELLDPPADVVLAVRHALDVARRTRGLITPTVLGALEAAGYEAAPGDSPVRDAVPVPALDGVVATYEVIRIPAGVRLDLGGTAKSWIAEQAARFLGGDAVLDAGGDLHVQFPQGGTVGIETPDGSPLYVNVGAGVAGVATSSVLKRAWAGGHHVIDPRTGRSADTAFVQVTALAGRVTVAETLAKVALLGADDVLRDVAPPGTRLLAFDRAGHVHTWQDGRWGRWAA
ncbi:thiamine biosynthesis lipoprotein [Deinococcus metalli]|uniref:FAD:protein FMN transferase n=1 Tax=Deinococcus metalli TaxID=1141878 RepID=A0A7W8KCL2_9DEIO|nr:FAD:protein FMN transferase [Deinococcus metalli]MBB5374573.1 thiamine biosynthesis lipoprotein [Deinococcus metalli]